MRGKLLILILFIAWGCVTPLDVNIERDEFLVVVEGFISTEEKVHTIRLSRTAKYGTIFDGVIRNIVNAEVAVRDQDGIITEFEESGSGIYSSPPNFAAQVGNTYTLLIELTNGSNYASIPETVQPVAPIDQLLLRYRKIPTADPLKFTSGVEVFTEFTDPADESNFYYWENAGTYLIETQPEDYIQPGLPRVAAPKDCCDICYITETNADFSVKIANDVFTDGNKNVELAAFIQDDGARYIDKYMVRIKQYSQSKEAHKFFSLLREQLSIDGDIFDAPPGQIRGNFYNTDDFDEAVLGYFWAGDVTIDSVFIPKTILEDNQRKLMIPDDCRVLPNSTTVKPDYW